MCISIFISFVCTLLNVILSTNYTIVSTTINFVNVVFFVFFALSDNLIQYQLSKFMLLLKFPMYLFSFVILLHAFILMIISICFVNENKRDDYNFGIFNFCFLVSICLYFNFINIVKFIEFKSSQNYILPISDIYKLNN